MQPELERGPGVGWAGRRFWRTLCKWTVLPWLALGWILRAGLKPCGLVNDTQRLLPAFRQPLPPPLLSTLSGFTIKQFWEKGKVTIIWTPLCGRPVPGISNTRTHLLFQRSCEVGIFIPILQTVEVMMMALSVGPRIVALSLLHRVDRQ